MKRWTYSAAAWAVACAGLWAAPASADSAEAACEIYLKGSDHTKVLIPCRFSQRQGFITIARSDGVTHDLSPEGDAAGTFRDQDGRRAYLESGLGDQGLIFRFQDQSIYVYWNANKLEPANEDNWTAPFTTKDYDATTRLNCQAAGDSGFGSCPAGILRMENGQASIVVQNRLGEQFTINFMKDMATGKPYVNATNREVEARMESGTWILNFANGEIWEVPLSAVEGG